MANIAVKIAKIKLHYPGLRPEYQRELIMMSNGKCQAKFIYMRTLSFGISLLFILNGCVSNSEKKAPVGFQNTDVSFSTENKPLQELFDLAEKKAEENIILYPGEYRVMKEGSFYPVLPVIYIIFNQN